ncbi:MAG: endolytic transglycosylase MltG [Desulfobacterales bacterium]|nr:endolytic transglycosylase MltG [Desulfobacterales bacterium]
MKKIFIIITSALIFFVAAAAGFYLSLLKFAKLPAGESAVEKVVAVKPGEGLKSISQRLFEYGIIQSPFKFSFLARIKGYDKRVKAGEYLFSARLTPAKILEMMVTGKVLLYKVTAPEGYTMRQIAAVVAEAGLTSAQDFLAAAGDPARVKTAGIKAETFEGYLFPDTYYFPKDIGPGKIVDTMVRRFLSVFLPDWKKRADALGFTVHEIVTLASIIEKETGLPAERPLISSVFHNRLKKRMRLESDPTVIYGIEGFNGNITRKDLAAERPYNTYRIRGLPPGPIANPGARALEAALYPADTDYLYFVSKNDSSHQFSTNMADHNRAVRKYQLNR